MEYNLPEYNYIKNGNVYTANKCLINYKIKADNEKEKILLFIWEGKNCLEKSEVKEKMETDLTEEGYKIIKDKIVSVLK